MLKHAVLDCILRRPSRSRVLYVETHAGRGRYDLDGAQARKGAEAADGVLALLKAEAPLALRPWLDTVRARGHSDYPGSPALALARLSAGARVILFERHPAEYAALVEAVGEDPRARIEKADGYVGALRLAPRAGEEMLVFVDPSYETSRDIDGLAVWTPRALSRWPSARLIIWVPLFRDSRETGLIAHLDKLGASLRVSARWPTGPQSRSALAGSTLIGFNIPDTLAKEAQAIANALEQYWFGAAS